MTYALPPRRFVLALAAVLAPLALAPAAQAQSGGFSCVTSGISLSCAGRIGPPGSFAQIIRVPLPQNDTEIAEATGRDRRWVDRCEPIIRQDRYGVRRYLYATRGCDIGRYED